MFASFFDERNAISLNKFTDFLLFSEKLTDF